MSGPSRKQQIEDMLRDDPNDPFLRYGLAMEYASAGDDPGARRCFEELVKVAPDYVPAYLQLGQLLIRLGEDGQARQVLQAGIATARQKGDFHAAGEMEGFLDSI
jgi:Tfp pilus assembly protein PilF